MTPQERATAQAGRDLTMLIELVEYRNSLGLTPWDVARVLGMTIQQVDEFERLEGDPRMSTVRQYAHAIGARIEHQVSAVEN